MSMNIPTIDISPYHPLTSPSHSSDDRLETARSLHIACRDIGFFYFKIDKFFSTEEMRRILDVGREFFSAPEEVKEEVHVSKTDGSRGWQRMKEEITLGLADHHEGYDLFAPSPYSKTNGSGPLPNGASMNSNIKNGQNNLRLLEGKNPYPSIPSDFGSAIENWTEKMKVLGMAVMEAMADGLGLETEEKGDLLKTMNDSFWCMRVIGYPPLAPDVEGISCGAHKDYGCLTFLHADPSPGSLQILPHSVHPSKATTPILAQTDSAQWIHADPPPGYIVVNIGRMWTIWSGGLYPATLHRVVHTLPTTRISAPFFFEPGFHTLVKPIIGAKKLLEEEGLEMWDNQVVYGEFLLDRITSNFGLK